MLNITSFLYIYPMRPLLLIILYSAIAPKLFASMGDTTAYSYVSGGKVVGKEWAVQKEKN